MTWEYISGGKRRRLSPEASAKLDRISDAIWSDFHQAFVIARNDNSPTGPESAPDPKWWRALMWSSAFAWLAVLIWLDRYS